MSKYGVEHRYNIDSEEFYLHGLRSTNDINRRLGADFMKLYFGLRVFRQNFQHVIMDKISTQNYEHTYLNIFHQCYCINNTKKH
jgi:hypothetical protein